MEDRVASRRVSLAMRNSPFSRSSSLRLAVQTWLRLLEHHLDCAPRTSSEHRVPVGCLTLLSFSILQISGYGRDRKSPAFPALHHHQELDLACPQPVRPAVFWRPFVECFQAVSLMKLA